MQGFLPHLNSEELKYRIVIAKLHDTTFAKVVRDQFIDVSVVVIGYKDVVC